MPKRAAPLSTAKSRKGDAHSDVLRSRNAGAKAQPLAKRVARGNSRVPVPATDPASGRGLPLAAEPPPGFLREVGKAVYKSIVAKQHGLYEKGMNWIVDSDLQAVVAHCLQVETLHDVAAKYHAVEREQRKKRKHWANPFSDEVRRTSAAVVASAKALGLVPDRAIRMSLEVGAAIRADTSRHPLVAE